MGISKLTVILLGFLLFNGCAYRSANILEVKAKKFRYGMLISCTDCEVKLQRNMDTNKQGGSNEKIIPNSSTDVGN
mgnify:CR=1 FL=1